MRVCIYVNATEVKVLHCPYLQFILHQKKKKKELNLIKMYGSSWGNQVCLKDGTF